MSALPLTQRTIERFHSRLVPGISKNSYGHAVAQQSGIPTSIVSRAIEVKDKLTHCQVIDPLPSDSPGVNTRENEYRAICTKFLEFDCENGDVMKLMEDIFQTRTEE